MKTKTDDLILQICRDDVRYSAEAYRFLLEALSFTQKKFRRERHVSGKELVEGLKIFSMEKFGPMTLTVLRHWGIHKTDDFGNMVFNLVHKKVLSKTDDDHIDHFRDVYDFDVVFNEGYRRKLHKDISRMH